MCKACDSPVAPSSVTNLGRLNNYPEKPAKDVRRCLQCKRVRVFNIRRKFCSHRCYGDSIRVKRECVICKKEVNRTIYGKAPAYCSSECRYYKKRQKRIATKERNRGLIKSFIYSGKTLEELGNEHNITRERVRQICIGEKRVIPTRKIKVVVYKNCLFCGIIFEVKKYYKDIRKFCCREHKSSWLVARSEKSCAGCEEVLPREEFYVWKSKYEHSKLSSRCKKCVKSQVEFYKSRNPLRFREIQAKASLKWSRKNKGIPVDDFIDNRTKK